jgi:hypothetical protein
MLRFLAAIFAVTVMLTTLAGTAHADPVTVSATADGMASAGSPTTVYGDTSETRIAGNDASFTKISYFSFDVPERVTAATLRLFAAGSQPDTTIGLHLVTAGAYSETTTNWNNRPTIGAQLATFPARANAWSEVDVAPYLPASGPVTFALTRLSKNKGKDNLFATRTNPTPANRPVLALEVDPGPPPPPDTEAPSTPTDLAAIPAGTSLKVDLTWSASTDNVGVTGYRVWRDGTPLGDTTTTNFADPTVQAEQTYSYTVAAFDAAGNTSAASNPVSVTVPPPPPGQLLFEATPEAGGLGGWCYSHSAVPVGIEAAADGAPARDGTHSFYTEVQDGVLIYSTERSEWSNGPNACSNYWFAAGDETWTAVSVFPAADFPTFSHWSLVTQWKEPDGGTPPQQISLQNDTWAMVGSDTISPRPKFTFGTIQRGQWNDFIVHHKWSSDPTVGFVEVYFQGQLALPKTFTRTIDNNNPLFLSAGQYRDKTPTTGTGRMWLDAIKVGTTREIVRQP